MALDNADLDVPFCATVSGRTNGNPAPAAIDGVAADMTESGVLSIAQALRGQTSLNMSMEYDDKEMVVFGNIDPDAKKWNETMTQEVEISEKDDRLLMDLLESLHLHDVQSYSTILLYSRLMMSDHVLRTRLILSCYLSKFEDISKYQDLDSYLYFLILMALNKPSPKDVLSLNVESRSDRSPMKSLAPRVAVRRKINSDSRNVTKKYRTEKGEEAATATTSGAAATATEDGLDEKTENELLKKHPLLDNRFFKECSAVLDLRPYVKTVTPALLAHRSMKIVAAGPRIMSCSVTDREKKKRTPLNAVEIVFNPPILTTLTQAHVTSENNQYSYIYTDECETLLSVVEKSIGYERTRYRSSNNWLQINTQITSNMLDMDEDSIKAVLGTLDFNNKHVWTIVPSIVLFGNNKKSFKTNLYIKNYFVAENKAEKIYKNKIDNHDTREEQKLLDKFHEDNGLESVAEGDDGDNVVGSIDS
ncbi:hypothetical protein QAD02_009138 [Eretmocerus hayati]|uniref:Uncharacterized protein n=1 Tax=Eretmocerus hayati TaxID=131215 RepID=A0ACC2N8F4_9HYME|nr:hypothetical protein QAD02_009138 [Eretmocerus hayati]